jgi:hypothetical protein
MLAGSRQHRVTTATVFAGLALANILRGTTLEVGTEEFFDDVAGASADEVVQRLVADWSSAGVSL